MKPELIAIGASAGGIQAIQKILMDLKPKFKIPIVVVQHLLASSKTSGHYSFSRYTDLPICEVEDKLPLQGPGLYLAPPGYHLLMERNHSFSLSLDEPLHYSRPSIDIFFESASWVYRQFLVGVLLTGANKDGAAGLQQIHRLGGITVVQDPETAELQTMPESALKLFKPDFTASLADIARILNGFEREGFYENQNLNR